MILLIAIKMLIAFKEKSGKLLNRLYRFQGSFWKGNKAQFKVSDRAIYILCVLIIPVAFCIHTVTSWLFATTYRPGWDSTNFGAYFISGAFLVGAGAVVVAMYVFRSAYHLKNYINEKHFEKNFSTGIFRVYQETLTNVARHSGATEINTNFEFHRSHVILNVADNGKGFDEAETKSKNTLGLIGMKERAMMFGGNLTIESSIGKGTTVRLLLPLKLTTETIESQK